MPNIDTDLFQVLTLALLFLALLSLLAALSVLSGIKKRLGSDDDAGSAMPSAQPQSNYDYQPTPVVHEPTPSYAAPASTFAAQPQAQTQEVSTGFVSVADATPAAGSAGLRGDEPEEQPFERDGRWWFKRGGELLVYDEGTGQWVAAPAGQAATTSGGAPVTAETQVPVAARADTGEGWKCASCGAVNGSTATTCRMCFAPR